MSGFMDFLSGKKDDEQMKTRLYRLIDSNDRLSDLAYETVKVLSVGLDLQKRRIAELETRIKKLEERYARNTSIDRGNSL